MKKTLSKLILIAILFVLPFSSFAEDDGHHAGGGNSGNGIGNGGGATAPLDGGLSFLVVAGIGYGAKKMTAKKKVNEKSEK